MKEICLQCHSNVWVEDFYVNFDQVIDNYNEIYFVPAKKMLDTLYEKSLLDNSKFFDEDMEVEFYELWHHEGRRARMGAMMMAPDYSWWHGFYECKKRFNKYMYEGDRMLESAEKAHVYVNYPAATGDTTKPEAIFGKK